MSPARYTHFAWLLLAGFLVGCSGSDRQPVQGTVTLDGEPLEGAAISFTPAEGGRPASGNTDAQGKFTLGSFTANDGLPPGSYKVSVVKTEARTQAQAAPTDDAENGEAASGESASMGAMETGVRYITPVKYASPLTTDLIIEIGPDSGPIAIDLTSN